MNVDEDLMHIARNMTCQLMGIRLNFQKKRLADAAEAKRQAEEGLQRRLQDEQIARQALEAGDTNLVHILNMYAYGLIYMTISGRGVR